MPIDLSRYPTNWSQMARDVKRRVYWTCQLCSKPCLLKGEDWSDFVRRAGFTVAEAIAASHHPKRYELDAAHVNHDPENLDADIRAWCNPCHCRYDLAQLRRKQHLNAERHGQLHLGAIAPPAPGGHGKDPSVVQLPLNGLL